jgi:hypothetical protein
MKKILLLILILNFFNANSQNKYFDYLVTNNNDTIYGTIQTDGLNKLVLREKNNSDISNGIKYYSHRIQKSKLFRYNDEIYYYEKPVNLDPIYENAIKRDSNYQYKSIDNHTYKTLKLSDYLITNNNDTIYGKITEPIFGKPHLVNKFNEKYKIDIKNIKSYRMQNNSYFNFSHIKNKYEFLKLLVNGNIKLFYDENYNKSYGFGVNSQSVGISKSGAFYLQTDRSFFQVSIIKFKKQMRELFPENKNFIDKIENEEFTYENLILIVNYVNDSK